MKKPKLREVKRLAHGHGASVQQNQDLSTISPSIKPLFSCLFKVKMLTGGKYTGDKVVACRGAGQHSLSGHCFCGVGVSGEVWKGTLDREDSTLFSSCRSDSNTCQPDQNRTFL